MIYRTRKLIKPEDLNARGTLFGGQLLKWIDEEAAIFAICQIGSKNVVTKYLSAIDFKHSPKVGDVVEIGMDGAKTGKTSLTFSCNVRIKDTDVSVISIEKIVFVKLDSDGKPCRI